MKKKSGVMLVASSWLAVVAACVWSYVLWSREAHSASAATLEALWAAHLAYEFDPAQKSVARTMATMVDEPSVNHVPTMVGGAGQANLAAFYRDHFIFQNPAVDITPVKRTVQVRDDTASLVDEMVIKANHTTPIDWLLPNVPPTGRPFAVPLVASVDFRRIHDGTVDADPFLKRFRGWRLERERIYWDQASVLKQVGLIDHAAATGPEQCDELLAAEMTSGGWRIARTDIGFSRFFEA
eukprot:CAMPEP_0198644536 /NCGR_PEP_ID=MMETSP1467-20131203/688_1 /TAXON_ID=1462469 /ORGANISM="unid. sp., Strain CCMP2135" /LENGTH=238 /DNA_ID=CAMNT_0044379993 /DNA_START=1 /DNA_END=716 /DNA_ORIENTATION=+